MQDKEWKTLTTKPISQTMDVGRLLVEWTASGRIATIRWSPFHATDIDIPVEINKELAKLDLT